MNKKFDLFFSIGGACSCTEALRKNRLQFFSYPFDWLYGSDILKRTEILTSDFNSWLAEDALEIIGENNASIPPKHIIRNNLTGICFNHDFDKSLQITQSIAKVKEKYDRRISRLLTHITQSDSVLVTYIQPPYEKEELNPDTLLKCHEMMTKKFGNKISLLYLFCTNKYTFENRNIIELNDRIKCIKFDYNGYHPTLSYVVNMELLNSIFSDFNVTSKHMNLKNRIRRLEYCLKRFLKKI